MATWVVRTEDRDADGTIKLATAMPAEAILLPGSTAAQSAPPVDTRPPAVRPSDRIAAFLPLNADGTGPSTAAGAERRGRRRVAVAVMGGLLLVGVLVALIGRARPDVPARSLTTLTVAPAPTATATLL